MSLSTSLARIARIAPALIIAAALFAGCGDDSDDDKAPSQTASGTAAADYDITGSWEGELRQEGLEPFTATVTIGKLEDPAQNTVQYTGIDCGGHWTYLPGDGPAFRFREVIDSGEGGNCKGVGFVTLTPFSDVGVDYQFKGGGVESTGVLKRTD